MSDEEDFQEEYIQEDEVAEAYDIPEYNEEEIKEMENEMDEDMGDEVQQIELEDDSIQGFFEHKDPVYSIALHPNNPLIAATGGGDDKSVLWKLDTGEKIADLATHTDSCSSVAFNFDGKYVASGGMDGKVFVYDTETFTLVTAVEGPSVVTWLKWHPRGNVLLAGSEDGTVWMWTIPNGNCMNVFTGHAESISCGQFTPDGKLIVTGSMDGLVHVWDPKTGAAVKRWSPEDGRFHQGPVTSLSVNKESTLILSGSHDGTTRLLQISTEKIIGKLDDHSDSVETVQFSPALNFVAAGSVDGKLQVWDYQSMKQRFTGTHDEAITKVSFTPDGTKLVSASVDGTLKVWDVRTGELLRTLKGHQNTVLDFDIRKDGEIVVTGSDDGTSMVFPLV
ncbi:hypothetical protein HK103_002689 [Boothiomyces macroporosus]|uniref:WD40 repeat-like protein n=1 Tax=Boothiomyces macroporosus TaxID=261099 RepID=A0AAD5UMN6_9FUNG|nr:hypothetical protein HK103_002689 [Boothiomyces macroporosus]